MTQTIDLGLVKGEPGFGVPKPGVSDVGKIPAVNSAGDGYELVSMNEGGTTNYDSLSNKPQINGIELAGNQTSQDLKINYILDLGDVRNGQEISITKEQKQLLLSENPPILKVRIDNVSYYMERFGIQTEAAMFSGSATLNGDYRSILAVSINASVDNPTVNIFVEDYGSVPLANIADAGKVPVVNSEGTGYELVPMNGGTNPQKEWKLLGETDCSQVGGNIIYSGLDNYTEFLVLAETVMNNSATASGYAVVINDVQITGNPTLKINNQSLGTAYYQWILCKFNGFVWEVRNTAGAIAITNLAMSSGNGNYSYNLVLDVGVATTFKLQAPLEQYQSVSGKITVWGR